jgi:hypothetical protein
MSSIKTMKTILLAALALLSLESLSLSLFTKGVFSQTARPFAPLLNTASHDHAGAGKIDFPATTAAHFDLQIFGELMPRPAGFLTAKENVSPRSVIVVRHFPTMIFAPKVPRYISKSVLNI